jgi:hypothetical protein
MHGVQNWAWGRLPSWASGPLDTHDLVQDTFAHVAVVRPLAKLAKEMGFAAPP